MHVVLYLLSIVMWGCVVRGRSLFWGVVLICVNLSVFGFAFSGVGRGVLRFGDARYRKPRSNLQPFCHF